MHMIEFVKGGVQRVSVCTALRHPFVRKVCRFVILVVWHFSREAPLAI